MRRRQHDFPRIRWHLDAPSWRRLAQSTSGRHGTEHKKCHGRAQRNDLQHVQYPLSCDTKIQYTTSWRDSKPAAPRWVLGGSRALSPETRPRRRILRHASGYSL